MDPALLREREAFRRKVHAQPVVEKRKERESDDAAAKAAKKAKSARPEGPAATAAAAAAARSLAPGANFSILAKIIKHMKVRYAQEDTDALTLEELLDETNQLDIGMKQRQWLESEALRNNPKVEVTEDGKYAFKPTFKLRDKRSLMRLLDRYDREGRGGICLEDIQESLPRADRVLAQVASSVIVVTRPSDKKKIIFFNDKSTQLPVDEEFQKLWRSVAVDGIDETKIEEYLAKQGITSMQDPSGGRRSGVPIHKRKKTGTRKARAFKKTNEHMGDILQEYPE